jgi:L-2,4-diaminobutyrate decarboxylase
MVPAEDAFLSAAALAGGISGAEATAALAQVAMAAVRDGALERAGPLPAGGPDGLARWPEALPEYGAGADAALSRVIRQVSAGSTDPSHPWGAGHLHCAPLAVAAAADLAVSVLNQSLDSWDQAPSASALEASVTRSLAELVYGDDEADAVVTTGGTESNLLGLLLARESLGAVRPVCGSTAHHSVARAAWLLGLPAPVVVPCPGGTLPQEDLDAALAGIDGPAVVVATAGTTGTGVVDPLRELAGVAQRHGAHLHVDAAYGGGLLFSRILRGRLDGIDLADTVSMDLHKFGWQPVAAGVLAVREPAMLAPLAITADYLNADDDTQAGLPDLLGRSLRTTRRPDAVKLAVSFAALGRSGMAALVEVCCAVAGEVARRIDRHPALHLWNEPTLSTVVFRPIGVPDRVVADVRRRLLTTGTAVLGRAVADGRLWLKLTLLNPTTTPDDFDALLDLVAATTALAQP